MRALLHRPTARPVAVVAALVVAAGLGAAPPSAAAGSGSAQAAGQAGGRLRVAAVQPARDGAAIEAGVEAAKKAVRPDGRTAVVVRLVDAPLATYRGGATSRSGAALKGTASTGGGSLDLRSAASKAYLGHLRARTDSFVGRVRALSPSARVTQRLDVVVGGVGLVLPAADLDRLAKDPQVAGVYVDRLEQPQTDSTPRFLGAPSAWAALGGQESAGEGTVVGVLDSGIWPEHPSLSDPDPSGKPYAAARPTRDGSARACDFSSGAFPGPAFTCNDKLIGAYNFTATYAAAVGFGPGEYTSVRDDDGHGTHTATTAAGNAGVAASIGGVPRGLVSGIAPRAHVIAYKVCGLTGCFGSDSAAAVQRAIVDDVDVINFSISGGSSPYTDVVSQAFLDAYAAGVFVAASAGNSGPGADTTDHREPWVTTVAASTGPRQFAGSSTLTSSDGATLTVSGVTVAPVLSTPTPVVDAAALGDALCANPTADGAFAGKVVICRRGGNARANKGFVVRARGGVGMILYNQSAAVTDLETDNHFVPAVHVQVGAGESALAFLAAHPDVTATITSGVAAPAQADVMASFSSRGGQGQSLGISKPDVTAPGVQVLAGMTPTPSDTTVAPAGELFQAIAGTSMSSPHVAGAAALLADLHPTWTPGQIRSALMTTAVTRTVKEDGVTPTDAFDDGSGRIDLAAARDPWFTIDETAANYVAKRADLQTANYPSVYVPALSGVATLSRVLTSVTRENREYGVSVSAPRDLRVRVPSELRIRRGGSATLAITVDGRDVPLGETRFATVVLRSGKRVFTIPLTVVRRQGPVEVTTTCAPDPVAVGAQTTCSVTMTNQGTDAATVSLRDAVTGRVSLVPGSVTGGTAVRGTVTATATIPGRRAPTVEAASVDPATTPGGGYLPLSLFGIGPIAGVGDETITNFDVPAFTVAGVSYSRVGIVSNGYLVLGGGDNADVSFESTGLPSTARPNNVLAPFWSDLDPSAGGSVRIGTLTDGVSTWLVVDYDGVPEFSDATKKHSFQVWIGLGAVEDVAVAYGANTGTGDGGRATIGIENPDGTQGSVLYVDGTGTLPVDGDTWRVTGTPGVTSSATVTYRARGRSAGPYVNYAEVTGTTFSGTAIARFAGSVTK